MRRGQKVLPTPTVFSRVLSSLEHKVFFSLLGTQGLLRRVGLTGEFSIDRAAVSLTPSLSPSYIPQCDHDQRRPLCTAGLKQIATSRKTPQKNTRLATNTATHTRKH